MLAKQIDSTKEQINTGEILALISESLDDILQFAFENIRTGACSTIHNVVEHVLLYLLHRDVIGETLELGTSPYISTPAMLPTKYDENYSQPTPSRYWSLLSSNAEHVKRSTWDALPLLCRSRWTCSHRSRLQNTSRQSWYHHRAVWTWHQAPLRRKNTRTGNRTFVAQSTVLVLIVVIDVKNKMKNVRKRRVSQLGRTIHPQTPGPILTRPTSVIEKVTGRKTTDPNFYARWTIELTMH